MSQLEKRNKLNSKKPTFRRAQSGIKPQLGKKKWRKPRGLHNKTRLCKRGKIVLPAVGWGSPKSVKGLEKDGRTAVVVKSFKDLFTLQEGHSVVLAAKLGLRKKIELLEFAIEKKIDFVNVKDPKKFVEESKKAVEAKKKASTKKKEEKKKKAEEVSKKAEEKKKEEEKHDHKPDHKHDHKPEAKAVKKAEDFKALDEEGKVVEKKAEIKKDAAPKEEKKEDKK